jgi:hypothetical protein
MKLQSQGPRSVIFPDLKIDDILSVTWRLFSRITGFTDFIHCLDLFLSSNEGKETPTLLGPLERDNQRMDNIHKPSDSALYTILKTL